MMQRAEIYLLPEGQAARSGVTVYYFQVRRAENGELVGRCDLRAGHNWETDISGNIGYVIFPEYRGNGYAAQACRLLLHHARAQGMRRIGICCDRENAASRKTCERVGAFCCGEITVPDNHELYAAGKRVLLRYELLLSEEEGDFL